MTVRGVLAWYLGSIIFVGGAGASAYHAFQRQHAAMQATTAQPVLIAEATQPAAPLPVPTMPDIGLPAETPPSAAGLPPETPTTAVIAPQAQPPTAAAPQAPRVATGPQAEPPAGAPAQTERPTLRPHVAAAAKPAPHHVPRAMASAPTHPRHPTVVASARPEPQPPVYRPAQYPPPPPVVGYHFYPAYYPYPGYYGYYPRVYRAF